jgi:hypothetical protein
MSCFGNSYAKMVDHLKLKGGRIHIAIPEGCNDVDEPNEKDLGVDPKRYLQLNRTIISNRAANKDLMF